MLWLSNSKVRLALLVNGLYLLSFALPSATPGVAPNARALSGYAPPPVRLRAAPKAPDYPTFAPPPGPTKAAMHVLSDQTDFYLSRELTLVRRRGHTLLLSPTFTVKGNSREMPRNVLLYFTAFSREQSYDRDSPFVITADGTELWRYGWRAPGDETPSSGKALHSAALDDSGLVAETVGHEVPFDIFARLVNAQWVTLRLGHDLVELTPEHLEVLRDMQRLARRAPPADKPAAGHETPGAYLDPGLYRPNK